MTQIEIDDETFTLTEDEKAQYDQLIAGHVYPMTALQMVAGNFEDIVVGPAEEQ